MHVLALSLELRFPHSRSLKDKRQALRPIVDGLRQRHHVSVAETNYQDQWQRAELGVAVVAGSPSQAADWLDQVERFVWARPDLEVLHVDRHWMEMDT